jgi:hypothetical protein
MSFRPHHHVRTSAVSVRKSCITRRAVSTWALVGRYILMKNISSAVRMEVCRQKLLACTTKTNTSGLSQQTSLSGGGRNMDMFGCGRMATCRSVVCTSRTRHVAPSDAQVACIGSVLPAYSIFPWLQICTYVLERTMCHSLMRETAIRLSKWCGPSKLCIRRVPFCTTAGLRRKMSSLVTY